MLAAKQKATNLKRALYRKQKDSTTEDGGKRKETVDDSADQQQQPQGYDAVKSLPAAGHYGALARKLAQRYSRPGSFGAPKTAQQLIGSSPTENYKTVTFGSTARTSDFGGEPSSNAAVVPPRSSGGRFSVSRVLDAGTGGGHHHHQNARKKSSPATSSCPTSPATPLPLLRIFPVGPTGLTTSLLRYPDQESGWDFAAWHATLPQSKNQDAVYSLFLHAHRCYDLIPVSTKLVVLDTRLSMAKAFTALTVNGLRAAPLWHAETSRFVGMLTITDFIHILHAFHFEDNNTAVTEEGVQQQQQQPQQQVPAGCSGELESTQLEAWRLRFAAQNRWRPLVSINPNDSVARAVEVLCREKVHRLPILDPATGNISYILTHKRIIKFLALYMHDLPRPDCMARTPKELGIGSWSNVLSVHMDTRLQDALATFLKNRVSALPVVDDENRVVDIYAKYDVMHLAHEKAYHNLETTVFEALKHRSQYFDGVQCCRETDSLQTVVEQLVRVDVHRLIVVDADRRVTGIVSLSDILRFLVLDQPCSAVNSASVSTVMMEGGGASGKEDTNNSPYGGSSQPAPVRASASSGSGAGTSTSSPPSAGALLHPPLAEEREEDEQLEEEVDDEAMAAALKQQQQQSQTVLAT